MYYVYVLKSDKDDSFYIGYSSNLKRIIDAHNAGKSPSTRHKRPYKLVYYDAFIKRFNRTIQEEHINHNEETLFGSTELFSNNLMDYLLFYNTKRIHSRISGEVPMDYVIQKSNMYIDGYKIFTIFYFYVNF